MTMKTTQGSRYRGFTITCVDRETGEPVDLTGGTFTGLLLELATRTARAVDGDISGVTLASGIIKWNPGVNDVGTAGAHELQIIATIGTLPLKAFRVRFDVEAAIPEPVP